MHLPIVRRPHAPQDSVLSSLRLLHKLAHLRMLIHSDSLEDADTDADGPARALGPSLFDFERTAAAVVRRLPSLQTLFLTTCGHFARRVKVGDGTATISVEEPTGKRWSLYRAWRVAEPAVTVDRVQDGKPILEELQDAVAEAIIEREELVLPDACKVGVVGAGFPCEPMLRMTQVWCSKVD